MFKMPARSQMTPASAAKMSGAAFTSVKHDEVCRPLILAGLYSQALGDEASRRESQDREALDERDDVLGNLRERLASSGRRSAGSRRRTKR